MVLFYVLCFNNPGDRITELDFVVANRMAAEKRDAGLVQFVQAAAHDVAKYAELDTLHGKTDHRKGRLGLASHRVDVA